MREKIINFCSYFFILLFFPSFVTGVFLPNFVCGIFVFINLILNFENLKRLFFKYFVPSLFFIFFYTLILISSIFSNHSIHSLDSSALYFTYLIYSFSLIILFIEKVEFRKLFLLCGTLTCFVLSIDAFYEFVNGSNILGFSSIDGRIAGLFGDRWLLGRYLIYILPILVGMYYFEKDKFNAYKYFFLITIILTSIVIIFSGERAAFLMFFIYLCLIFIFFLNKLPKFKIFLFLITIIFLIILPFLFSETSERIKDNFIIYLTSNDYEKNQYLSMFVTSWKMFVDNLLIGIGPNNFRYDCSNPIYYVSKWSCSTHPHSTFFQILAEVGILGFLLVYSVLAYFVYKSVILVFSKDISYKSFGMYSLQCAIIIYLFPFMITGNFFLSWYGFIYYLPISLFMVYSSKIK